MKKKMLFGLLAIGVLATGCSKDEMNGVAPEAGAAEFTLTVKGENGSSRATGVVTEADENAVKNIVVYVFNSNTGAIETNQTFDQFPEGTISATVQNLSVASKKDIVVLVNVPTTFKPTVNNYTDLQKATLALETQAPRENFNGLFMSGEKKDIQLVSGANSATVTVKRIAAKVKLGTVKIADEALDEAARSGFKIKAVSIQNARSNALTWGNTLDKNTGFESGIADSGAKGYLRETYNDQSNYYFYVFPNTGESATLLTIEGEYNAKTVYYPFVINKPKNGNEEDLWIERNKIYTLNITLKKLGNGGDNPDVPNEEVNLGLVVDVEGWEDELSQDVEW